MGDRTLKRLRGVLLRDPDDVTAWLELAELLRRGAPEEALAGLAPALPGMLRAAVAHPHDRTLVEAIFPRLGWDLLASGERPPGSWWHDQDRLGDCGHLYDKATGMPLFVRIRSLGAVLAWVPPGSFVMGRAPEHGHSWEKQVPVERVGGLWMAAHETTAGEFREVRGDILGWMDDEEHPVHRVHWYHAMEFTRRLTERERAAHPLAGSLVYRLPGEAEWEYACRAGSPAEWLGAELHGPLEEVAVLAKFGGEVREPVGSRRPNPWGLHDMFGNVSEWCLDEYQCTSELELSDGTPRGPIEDHARDEVVRFETDYEYYNAYWAKWDDRERSRFGRIEELLGKEAWQALDRVTRARVPIKVVRGGGGYSGGLDCYSTHRESRPAGDSGFQVGFRILATLRFGPL